MRHPREAWILALEPSRLEVLRPLDDVVGLPHVFRTGCALARAGIERVFLLVPIAAPLPGQITTDLQLRGVELTVTTRVPDGAPEDELLVVRGERVFHPELPHVIATEPYAADLVTMHVDGLDLGVWRTNRFVARSLARAAVEHRLDAALDDARAVGGVLVTPERPAMFSIPVYGSGTRREAERRLRRTLPTTHRLARAVAWMFGAWGAKLSAATRPDSRRPGT